MLPQKYWRIQKHALHAFPRPPAPFRSTSNNALPSTGGIQEDGGQHLPRFWRDSKISRAKENGNLHLDEKLNLQKITRSTGS